MLPKRPIRKGEKERKKRKFEAGIRVKREALRVAVMTPGLSEKFTGPIIPRNPARTLAKPVIAIPWFIRRGISGGLIISFID